MKQTKHTMGSTFALLVIIFLFVQCNDRATKESKEANTVDEFNSECLPLAYIEKDSILAHFDYYNQILSNFEDKIVKQQNSISANYKKLENEMINFQTKAQNNAFVTQERAQQEYNRIQRMQSDLEKQSAQMEREFAMESQMLQQQITDTLRLGIKEFNTPQKYQMIFANVDYNILYADPRYDITSEVIEFLNKRFKVK